MAKYSFGDNDLPPVPPLSEWPLVPPEEATDMFECRLCGAPLPLAGIIDVEHDCSTGTVAPAG